MKKYFFFFYPKIDFFHKKKGTGTGMNRNRTEPEPDRTGADRNRTEPYRTVGFLPLARFMRLTGCGPGRFRLSPQMLAPATYAELP